jgi:hypothetical protein
VKEIAKNLIRATFHCKSVGNPDTKAGRPEFELGDTASDRKQEFSHMWKMAPPEASPGQFIEVSQRLDQGSLQKTAINCDWSEHRTFGKPTPGK